MFSFQKKSWKGTLGQRGEVRLQRKTSLFIRIKFLSQRLLLLVLRLLENSGFFNLIF